ncbi:protein TonB [Chitinophaga niastensis]|uniref:Protein TonB n=1 Tax=Chitinophaga niastensis TaxID=536980 RepID=A0A2P8HLY3_CHINA|nr:energy transducer TonB [Chitinophaga niastensis]PSL47218.1 protein TonB [Chitinophaga niastensis]
MDSTKIPGNEFLDILFDGRNKDYGAYELRSRYDKRVRNAVIGTASIVLVMIGGYVLNNKLMAAENNHHPLFVDKTMKLDEVKIPEPDPVIPPPPPVHTAPPPAAATIDFTTPVITNKEVPPDQMPPRHEEMNNKVIGFENKDGELSGNGNELVDVAGPGNNVVAPPTTAAKETIFTVVEIPPSFPGGEDALMKYLGKSIRYPAVAQENGIEGTIYIQFVVDRDGNIKDVKTVGAAKGGGLEEEAARVVRNMPKWKPGRQNNQSVAVFFSLPIRFKLTQ